MVYFDKFHGHNPRGWNKKTHTLTVAMGQTQRIALNGSSMPGFTFMVESSDPTICLVHEEEFAKSTPDWTHYVLTGLRDGVVTIHARELGRSIIHAKMTAKVVGHASVSLVYFPGERVKTFVDAGRPNEVIMGTIYVVGGSGAHMKAAGGPPTKQPIGGGGHFAGPTPAGIYTLGPRAHVTTRGWPYSVIRWGAPLRINKRGEVEYANTAGHWHQATGAGGTVTRAEMAYYHRQGDKPTMKWVVDDVRKQFIDTLTGKLISTTWKKNDFGLWGWRLYRHGKATVYYIHTTPPDELGTAKHLINSHGCIHVRPVDRDRFWNAGFLKRGMKLEVRPYDESGPP